MKHVVFMTFAGMAYFAYAGAPGIVLALWMAFVVLVGFATGVMEH